MSDWNTPSAPPSTSGWGQPEQPAHTITFISNANAGLAKRITITQGTTLSDILGANETAPQDTISVSLHRDGEVFGRGDSDLTSDFLLQPGDRIVTTPNKMAGN